MSAASNDCRLKAISLAGRWQRLVQSHLPLRGGPCACVLGIGNIAVADFEQDLLEFLHAKYNANGALRHHFDEAGYCDENPGSLVRLLQSIVRDPAPSAETGSLLAGLDRSLSSLESGH